VPAQALGGRITITAIDHDVQEGARHFALAGGGPQVIDLHTQTPIDLTRETNGDVMLLATMRLDSALPADLTIGVACGPTCTAAVPIASAKLRVGAWRTIGIPLKCFARTADMARIETPFQLRTAQPFETSIARVAVGTVADDVVACPR